jgi:hypothetical protein
VHATAGVPVAAAVFASYTVTDPTGQPGTQWRAVINFGDGQGDFLVIPVQKGDQFEFVDSHTYLAPGTYTVTIMIAVPGSMLPNDNTVTTKVTVDPGMHKPPASPQLTGSGLTLRARADKTFRAVVARFSEIKYPGRAFEAKINWGDATAPTAGQIRPAGTNRFTVTGAHQYRAPGTYRIIVHVHDSLGHDIAVHSAAVVVKNGK